LNASCATAGGIEASEAIPIATAAASAARIPNLLSIGPSPRSKSYNLASVVMFRIRGRHSRSPEWDAIKDVN
jgi:hypothetical protein